MTQVKLSNMLLGGVLVTGVTCAVGSRDAWAAETKCYKVGKSSGHVVCNVWEGDQLQGAWNCTKQPDKTWKCDQIGRIAVSRPLKDALRTAGAKR